MKKIIKLPPYRVEKTASALSEVIDWGLTLNNVPKTWEQTMGEDINIYILDTAAHTDHPDLIDNFKGGENFSDSKTVKDSQGHGCILPNGKVYTSAFGLQTIEEVFKRINGINHCIEDGSIIKEISNLNIKTLSLDKNGKMMTGSIKAIHKLNYDGDILKIKTKDGEIGLTPWHPVFILSSSRGDNRTIKKIKAEELKMGDRILLSGTSKDFVDYTVVSYNNQKDTIKLDENLAYLMGLISSDGHLYKQPRQYRVSFSNNNAELGQQFKNIIKSLFNLEVKSRRNKTCTEWYIDNKRIFNLLIQLGIPKGAKSTTLKFPQIITKSPHSVIFSFFSGLIDGDGSVCKKTGRIRIISASKDFVEDSVLLLKTLGIRASYFLHKPKSFKSKDGRFCAKNDCFCIRISSDGRIQKRLKIKKCNSYPLGRDRVSSSIISITKERYTGDLYDFTIEEGCNYVANGFIVSNTHCAGITAALNNGVGVVGIAPKANIYLIKVLNDQGIGSATSITNGLKHCYETIGTKDQCHIVSMSLGAEQPIKGAEKYIKKLYEKNIPVICAAGNSGKIGINYPARYPETISIGAYDRDGNLANFSTRGDELDFVAPGVDIYSTWKSGGYAKLSGTSMSTPFITGIVALMLAKHKKQEQNTGLNDCKTVQQIKDHLVKYSIDKGSVGKDPDWGYGVIDITRLFYGE